MLYSCLFSGGGFLFALPIYFGDRAHFLVTHNVVVILIPQRERLFRRHQLRVIDVTEMAEDMTSH